ncbi:ATP-binding cassette domain-containing protein [Promicromonospora sp. MEB111]|uniref:ABC transporter ATP-binding protein n=1 Tax=Promicromonospora sp. MEB111 TaxID=3040301 RepID=UPI00254CFDBF|nr:ATP-binding cassette domain-containing protein [Promicromonospora sp. MEB111]
MTTPDSAAGAVPASAARVPGPAPAPASAPAPATAPSRGTAIEVAGLHASYGDHHVLDGVDLTVPAGSVYALLGPNGAGKTTMVNILSTLLAADAGEVRVAGHDVRREPARVRAAIGVTGQFSAIDMFLTGRENLRLMADLTHLDRATATRDVEALLDRFDLADAADRRALTWSGGMRRRLDLAMTLITRPRLIFLDEPTTGLDPRSRRAVWQVVREQVADGVTVLLTTQYLDEADALADRVGVLDAGTLLAEGTPSELKAQVPGGATSLDDVFLALTGHAADPADTSEVTAR